MEQQQYPGNHFEYMRGFSIWLGSLPAQLLEHNYSYETFGSWYTIFRFNGIIYRLIYDGRDQRFSLDVSDSRKQPYLWKNTNWTASSMENLFAEVGLAIRAGFNPI